MTTEYSGTPLVKKLGLKEGMNLILSSTPADYLDLLNQLPEGIREAEAGEKADFIHHFSSDAAKLKTTFPALKVRLSQTGGFWVSWAKKTSPLFSGLDGNQVRAIGLEAGLVDVKVCAVSADWSGIKFMYRVKDRK